MISNKNGQDLVKHLMGVSKMSVLISTKYGLSDKNIERCRIAGLLHDIGKAIEEFQSHMQNCSIINIEDLERLHHDCSWEFISGLNIDPYIKNIVLWHHGKTILSSGDEINRTLSESDIEKIQDVYNQLNLNFEDCDSTDPPPYIWSVNGVNGKGKYPKNGRMTDSNCNAVLFLLRSIVIFSDHLISKMSIDELNKFLEDENYSLNEHKIDVEYSIPKHYNKERIEKQLNISKEVLNNKITIIPATAGFGKTVIGLLSTILVKKRCYWVCPRNIVAENVYETLKNEIEAFGCNISMELYLTSERKKCTDESLSPFSSDIVITNIDNFVRPMVDYNVLDNLGNILDSTVIFDEFHEFANESPLFASFINFMRMRTMLNNETKTILLSATPSFISELWGNVGTYKVECGETVHNKNFKVSFVKNYPNSLPKDGIVITNSLTEAQGAYQRYKGDILLHSYFIKKHKMNNIEKLYKSNGKNGTYDKSVTSAPIVQASLDVSFSYMVDTILSPESTIQRLGRLDRWGKKLLPCEAIFVSSNSKSNKSSIDMLYENNLNEKWCSCIEEYVRTHSEATLKNFYELYEKFNNDNRSYIIRYLEEQFYNGESEFSEYCYPRKYIISSKSKKVGNGNLRNPTGSFNYIVKQDGKWLNEVFSCDKNEIERIVINENFRIAKAMKELNELGFNYQKRFIKYIKDSHTSVLAKLKKMCKDPNLPLPCFEYTYSDELGLIKKDI